MGLQQYYVAVGHYCTGRVAHARACGHSAHVRVCACGGGRTKAVAQRDGARQQQHHGAFAARRAVLVELRACDRDAARPAHRHRAWVTTLKIKIVARMIPFPCLTFCQLIECIGLNWR